MVDGVIVLYEQNETNFTSNGLGYLSDVIECTVSEELNGEYELEMEYPVDGIRYSEIQHRRILYVKPNPYEDPQPFRIYNINRPIDGRVEINARHISYDLSGYTVSESEDKHIPFSTSPKMFCEKIPSAMTELNSGMPRFTFWTNSVEEYDSETYAEEGDELKEKHWIFIDTPSSVRSLIGQFTEKYKGEFKFDKYAVKFYGPISGQSEDDKHYRGTDSGVVLRYGKNLTDLMQEEDSDKGMYTHLYPYWSGTVNTTKTETDSESDESSSSTTTTYSSNSEEKVVTMTNKLYPIFNHDVGYKRVLIYEVNSDWNEKHPNNTNDATPWPSEEDFEELCKEYIKNNELGAPKITLTASFVQLSRSAEYEDLKPLEKVLLGDTVSVLWEDLGVNSTLKCTSTEYDALTDSYKSITLGNDASSSISSTVAATSSGLSGVASSMSDKVSKEEFYNQTYDTALSTTSTNAVQNKVVTSKFNTVDKTCNGFKNEINNILSIVENLNPSGGAAITYGYSLPTGGNDGDAYVQITSTPKDPRAVVSESTVHNNFEVSNFTKSGTKYSFDISGTVDADQINYALVNVDNLRSGSEYKVTMRLSHDVPNASLNRSHGTRYVWTKAFGLFVGSKNNLKSEYVTDAQSGSWFSSNDGLNEITDWDGNIRSHGPTACYQPQMQYQGFYKDASNREYDFYFTASGTSASFGFVFDDCLDETACNVSVVDMEVIYVGSPKIPTWFPSAGSVFANAYWNSNWEPQQGIEDKTSNGGWTNWGGGNNYAPEPFLGFTFNQPTTMDRIRLNAWEGQDYTEPQDVVRTLYIEASTDDEAWDSENKEWVNVLPGNTSVDISYSWNLIKHVYFNINKGTYHDIRIRFVSPRENGKLEAIQCYLIEDQIPDNHVKDLFFKIDGEWLVYPRDDESFCVTTYGYDEPDNSTGDDGDCYLKLTNVEVEETAKHILKSSDYICNGSYQDNVSEFTDDTTWHGFAAHVDTASYSWIVSKQKIKVKSTESINIKGNLVSRGAGYFLVTLSSENTGNPWQVQSSYQNNFMPAETGDFDITLQPNLNGEYYVWLWIDQNGNATVTDLAITGETYTTIKIIDEYYKVEGEWLVYPNDPEDEPVFTYGTEDPDENTKGDIYAKLINNAIDSISYKVDDAWLLGPSGGGGSGGGGSFDVLYDASNNLPAANTSGTTIQRDYTLSNNIDNYDEIVVAVYTYRYSNTKAEGVAFLSIPKSSYHAPVIDPDPNPRRAFLINASFNNVERRFFCCFSSDGTKILTEAKASDIYEEPMLLKVYGIKSSGGSGGGGSACYNLIDPPITSGDSGMFGSATATSSLNSNFGPGTAFNGVQAELVNGRNGWLSTDSDQSPTLTLAFNGCAKILNFVKLEILNNGSAYCWDPIYIEGSNDGSTWTNILKTGQSVVFDLEDHRYSYYIIELDRNKYSHFRIRGAEPFYKTTNGYPACIFSNVLIYGSDDLDNGLDGYTHLDLSTATLSAFRPSYGLPTYSNGVVNLPNHNVTVDYNAVASTNLIDLTNITEIKVTYNIKSMGNYKPVVGIGDSNVLPVENMSSRWGPIINVGYSFVNTSQLNQRVTFSWDVTSYTGSHYICAAVDERTEMDVYDIAYK